MIHGKLGLIMSEDDRNVGLMMVSFIDWKFGHTKTAELTNK